MRKKLEYRVDTILKQYKKNTVIANSIYNLDKQVARP